MTKPPLTVGSPAPWFSCRTSTKERFVFDTVAGRYIVLCFFGSAQDPVSARSIQKILASRDRFNDQDLCLFGISVDPKDESQKRIVDVIPGIRFFWDFDNSVSKLFGAARSDGSYHPITYILDPAMRILSILPHNSSPNDYVAALFAQLDKLPPLEAFYRVKPQAPVLILPRIFEPELCQSLTNYYNQHGGYDSGFMRDINGKTTSILDYKHKRRRDCQIEDEFLQKACIQRIQYRLVPEIQKAFQFEATRIERNIVACYDAEEEGHFRAHRDNTTKGTAHRRFAVSLFLNSGEYDGGFLRFPEFGPGLYTAPAGGAVVFSCSILHEATPVTKGRRYMYLPFLYDEAARKVRENNFKYLEEPLQESLAELASSS